MKAVMAAIKTRRNMHVGHVGPVGYIECDSIGFVGHIIDYDIRYSITNITFTEAKSVWIVSMYLES